MIVSRPCTTDAAAAYRPVTLFSRFQRLVIFASATALTLTAPCNPSRCHADDGSSTTAVASETGAAERAKPIEVTRNQVFENVAGTELKADVYRPAGDAICPIVVMIHGGAWSSGDKWNLQDHAREMAQAGYVAISINYRLSPIYRYPAHLDDCAAAVKWAVKTADQWHGDKQRLGVWGYSAGAHLAGMLATHPPEGLPKISAAVLGGAPCEFSFIPEDSRVLTPVFGGSRKNVPDVYRDASPTTFASVDACPTFFFHGTTDLLVPQSSSRGLYEKLKSLDVPSEYYSVEGSGHLLTFLNNEARRAAIQFLDKHLMAND